MDIYVKGTWQTACVHVSPESGFSLCQLRLILVTVSQPRTALDPVVWLLGEPGGSDPGCPSPWETASLRELSSLVALSFLDLLYFIPQA